MNLDEDDIEVLRAVEARGGRDVLFSTVRSQTGFTRSKSRSRWDKLVDNGYLLQRYTGEEGESERTATLTDRARQHLSNLSGDEEGDDEELTRDELEAKVERLERRLDVLTTTQSGDLEARVKSLEEGLERTADDVSWHDAVADACWAHHSDNDDRDFGEALEEIVDG